MDPHTHCRLVVAVLNIGQAGSENDDGHHHEDDIIIMLVGASFCTHHDSLSYSLARSLIDSTSAGREE